MEQHYINIFKSWFINKYGPISQDSAFKCFTDYVDGGNMLGSTMDKSAVTKLLKDAGVGGFIISPGLIAGEILSTLKLNSMGFTWADVLKAQSNIPSGLLS